MIYRINRFLKQRFPEKSDVNRSAARILPASGGKHIFSPTGDGLLPLSSGERENKILHNPVNPV